MYVEKATDWPSDNPLAPRFLQVCACVRVFAWVLYVCCVVCVFVRV